LLERLDALTTKEGPAMARATKEIPTTARPARGRTLAHSTKNDLSEATRGAMCELLNARLADAVDLTIQAKQAHWNVKGPHFFSLHELFDAVADGAREYADLIAERAVQLGGVAEGTVQLVARRSTIGEYPLEIVDGVEHLVAVSAALASFGKEVRRAIDAAADAGDMGTADLFTEVSRGVDKHLWMVEAHGQATR
jgi:starvation-inducible DNA-binding protein